MGLPLVTRNVGPDKRGQEWVRASALSGWRQLRSAGRRLADRMLLPGQPGCRDVVMRFGSRADGKETVQGFEIDALDDEAIRCS
jgi:hypothetical protein